MANYNIKLGFESRREHHRGAPGMRCGTVREDALFEDAGAVHTPWNEENPTIAMMSAAITKTIMPTTM
jgi:hypothetical protein